jgi:hypothetical protein
MISGSVIVVIAYLPWGVNLHKIIAWFCIAITILQ